MEKPQSPILNKSNVEELNQEKNSITQKDQKQKNTNKKMRVKIKTKNKLESNQIFFYWRVKLKRKIN
jgi:hypothetical protein